jgi:predicted RNase H-like HicB family nuclease
MSGLTVEIIPDLEQVGFTARVPDIPAYGEGDTEEQALADLREALTAYIKAFGLADAMARLDFRRPLWRSRVDLADIGRS